MTKATYRRVVLGFWFQKDKSSWWQSWTSKQLVLLQTAEVAAESSHCEPHKESRENELWRGTSNFSSSDLCLPWRPYLLVIQTVRYWVSCIQNKTYGRQLIQTTTVSTPHNPSWTCPPPSVLALHPWMPYLESSLVNKRLKCRRSQGSQVWSWEVYGVESIS